MTIYVDPNSTTSSNANTGTTLAPLRTLWYAQHRADITNERVELTNTTLDAPYHGRVQLTENYVLGTDGTPQFVSPSGNISHNGTREFTTHRMIFQSTTDWGGGTGGTVSNEADNTIFTGAQVLRLDGTSSRAYTRISGAFGVRGIKKWRMRIKYKAQAGDQLTSRVEQQISGSEYFWHFDTKSWDGTQGTSYAVVRDESGNAANSTSWTEIITTWIDADADTTTPAAGGSSNIYLTAETGNIIDVEYVYIEVLNEWVDQGSDVWRLPYVLDGNESRTASVTGRTPSTVTGVRYATNKEDFTTYRIAEGDAVTQPPTSALESYFKTTDYFIEFKVESGNTITDYYLFMIAGSYGLDVQNASGTAQVENISVINSDFGYYKQNAGVCNLYDCIEYFSLVGGYRAIASGGTSNAHNCKSYQPEISAVSKDYGGGFVAGSDGSANAATVNCYGCHVKWTGDDSYQPIGAGILNLYGCTDDTPKGKSIELNCSNSGSMIIGGGTMTGAFRDQSASNTTVIMNGVVCASMQMDGTERHTSTYTFGTDVYCEAADISYSGGAVKATFEAAHATTSNINFSYTVDYNDDLSLPASSVLVGAANKWWTGPNPVGANGEPFSDFDTDAGGIQSTHSKLHPINL